MIDAVTRLMREHTSVLVGTKASDGCDATEVTDHVARSPMCSEGGPEIVGVCALIEVGQARPDQTLNVSESSARHFVRSCSVRSFRSTIHRRHISIAAGKRDSSNLWLGAQGYLSQRKVETHRSFIPSVCLRRRRGRRLQIRSKIVDGELHDSETIVGARRGA
jgi:hypothetical protein